VIGHLDLDYFYAQVEEVEDPSLRSLAVVVCVYSGRTEDSGVVSTANYAARAKSVKSGMPIKMAKKHLEGTESKFVRMDHQKYEVYSERIFGLLKDEVDVLEQTGIDEAFFDITKKCGGDYGLALNLASEMKLRILEDEHLTCSIGLAPNKVVAKLASDFKKPDGLTVVTPGEVAKFMNPVTVEKLYGIGPKSAALLKEMQVKTIGDLAEKDIEALEHAFGRKFAAYLHNAANGSDEEPVIENAGSKQLSRIITLKADSQSVADITAQLSTAIQDVHRRAAEKGLFFRSISAIGILPNLSIRTKTKTLEAPTNDSTTLERSVSELISSLVNEAGALRRVGLRISDLTEGKMQRSLADFLE
jgi:DNA polymerase IV (archaeal DinB-like DNA polymerase)